MLKECWGGGLSDFDGLGEKRSPLHNNVCLKKTFKCQKVQEIRLVRNEPVSHLGEMRESVKL